MGMLVGARSASVKHCTHSLLAPVAADGLAPPQQLAPSTQFLGTFHPRRSPHVSARERPASCIWRSASTARLGGVPSLHSFRAFALALLTRYVHTGSFPTSLNQSGESGSSAAASPRHLETVNTAPLPRLTGAL